MKISNTVTYYKTAKESIAAANPSMRKLLCPEPSPLDAARILIDRAAGAEFKQANYLLDMAEKCLQCMGKGELGETIFKIRLKRDKRFLEELKNGGLQI